MAVVTKFIGVRQTGRYESGTKKHLTAARNLCGAPYMPAARLHGISPRCRQTAQRNSRMAQEMGSLFR